MERRTRSSHLHLLGYNYGKYPPRISMHHPPLHSKELETTKPPSSSSLNNTIYNKADARQIV
jgi:hypothetical protein